MKASLFYPKARLVVILVMILGACKPTGPTETGRPPSVTPEIPTASVVAPTDTPALSPTPEPLAASVNGDPLTLAEYQVELGLYQMAVERELTPEDETIVLEDLIDQTLLAQAARQDGFVASEDLLNERLQRLADQLGDQQALDEWIATHGYTQQSFRRALARAVSAAWKRDQIIAAVPPSAEQVHAFQILLYNADEANQVYSQLQTGYDFFNLALEYDPITAGELGWFPRGYLPDQDLDEIVFNLIAGEYSPVVETLAGYHIVMVVERDPQRPLSASALQVLQAQALQDWIGKRRNESEIEILVSCNNSVGECRGVEM